MDKLLAIPVFFNKGMAEDFKLGDIYQMVIDGEWTLDKLFELSESVGADLNNDDRYDQNDRYALTGQYDTIYQLFHSAGERYCSIDDGGIPYMSCTSERAVDVLSKVLEYMGDERMFLNRAAEGINLSVSDSIALFRANQTLFFMRPLSAIFDMRDMKADFGVIPTPKFDEKQESYHTSIGYTGAVLISIPVDAKSIENSAKILDTLCAVSHVDVNPAFYDVVLGTKLVRDEKSTENLDIILNNRIYDPGCMFAFGGIATYFLNIKDPASAAGTIASTLASLKDKTEADIEKYMEIIGELE